MSTLSQGDLLRRRLEETKCCNPPVQKPKARDSSEITHIRRLKAIGQSTVAVPIGKDASFTISKNAGCPINATIQCTTTAMIPLPIVSITPFSPALFSGLTAWFDAMDSSTLTITSSRVTTWADKSSNENDFVQATLGLAPTLRKVPGDKTCLYMATNTQQMLTQSPISSSVCGANPRSMFFICMAEQPTSNVTVGYGSHTVAVPRNSFGLNNAANAGTIYAPYAYGTDITLSSTNNNVCMLEGFYSGTVMSGFVNGTSIGTSTLTLNTTQTVLYLGARPDAIGNVFGTMCEIVMYDTYLSEERRQQVEGYLAWKWGIENTLPLSHPYKLAPPATNI